MPGVIFQPARLLVFIVIGIKIRFKIQVRGQFKCLERVAAGEQKSGQRG